MSSARALIRKPLIDLETRQSFRDGPPNAINAGHEHDSRTENGNQHQNNETLERRTTMDPHLISATLSFDDHQAAIAAIDVLRQKLPFLIDLTSVSAPAWQRAATSPRLSSRRRKKTDTTAQTDSATPPQRQPPLKVWLTELRD
jgi:hypothetical protein